MSDNWSISTVNEHVDVLQFHRKFGIDYVGPPRLMPRDLFEFRLKFLQEELTEFHDAHQAGNLMKAFDALLDLSYVLHGTAQLMGLPWYSGHTAVHQRNMQKIRVENKEESLERTGRGHAFDVVKPEGWVSPDRELNNLLDLWEKSQTPYHRYF